jgi:hypothetical protein
VPGYWKARHLAATCGDGAPGGVCGNGRFKLGYSHPVRIPPSHGARYLQLHYEKTTGTASLSFQSNLILVSVKLDYGSQGLLPTQHNCWAS